MFRFIHSSDLHLGKRFGHLPDDLRGRLREARHGAISRLAIAARSHDATAILLAGDTFDTETPTPMILRQALSEMGGYSELTWVLLPGNHDSLEADQLWDAARRTAPPNVVFACEPQPVELASGVVLLPAPCTTRRPGRDLTAWMTDAATPDGILRIGLAHGPIQTFSEDAVAAEVIAPDRAALAGLDYLALGDWHGQLSVNPRTFYSGTPEPDRFKHDKPGRALLVGIAGPGAPPNVQPIETASFSWRTLTINMLANEDGVEALEAVLPPSSERRQTLARLVIGGRTQMAGRVALNAAIAHLVPDFAHFESDLGDLVTDCDSTDLDRIDRAGALRQAADALLGDSQDDAQSVEDREVARQALIRLFTYCEAVAP